MSQTLIILKPDAIEKNLIPTVLNILAENHLELTRVTLKTASEQQLAEHYRDIKDKPFFPEVVSYMSRTPLFIAVVDSSKVDALTTWRQLLGATDPAKADPNSIRSLYGDAATMENVDHGSDSEESAAREIQIWFGE